MRARYIGAVRAAALVAVDPPAARWSVARAEVSCLRSQRRSVLLPRAAQQPGAGGAVRGGGAGEGGWVALNGARDSRGGGAVQLRADKRLSQGAEADMARLQALLQRIPAFALPLAVQEAFQARRPHAHRFIASHSTPGK